MRFHFDKKVNARKLCAELASAGYPGNVTEQDFEPHVDLDEAAALGARAIIEAHDPTPAQLTRAQKLEAIGLTEEQAAFRIVQVKGASAPGWAKAIVAAHVQKIDSALS